MHRSLEGVLLHDFLMANRSELIERCRAKVAKRRAPLVTPVELGHGIPLFLDQLAAMLPGGTKDDGGNRTPRAAPQFPESQIEDGAKRHGQELLRHDFTIDQVVHDYGDLCQAVTQLADEQGVAITVHEFGMLNIRLDNAIAGAVTEFSRNASANEAALAASAEGLRGITHEMRNLHSTTIVAITAIERGTVGFGGATSQALKASLAKMGKLIDCAAQLAEAPRH